MSGNPYPPFRQATWRQRVEMAFGVLIVSVFGVAMFIGAVLLLGRGADNLIRSKVEHDNCLRNATNGYEIRECR
jgi:hypothetical protein